MNQREVPLLELIRVSKHYPGVVANSEVDLSIASGEIHALLGENGAGKSTLVKIMYGLVNPTSGQMLIDGKPYSPNKPSEARSAGLGMVFQHFTLFEAMTVAENIAIGMENPPPMKTLEENILTLSKEYGLPIEPKYLVADISAGERQRVEIIRCLLQNPRLIIMDEPTSVLTPQEVDILFQTLRKLSAEGTAILYISHKLNEIKSLCDRATILRAGKLVGSCDPKVETVQSMAEMMLGSDLAMPDKSEAELAGVLLSANNITSQSANVFGTSLKNISFDLQSGSIFGIGGIAGNGQDELLATLSGEKLTKKGSLFFEDLDISQFSPNKRRNLGLLSAPEERLGHACAPQLSLVENCYLTARNRKELTQYGFLNSTKSQQYANHIIKTFDVRTPSADSEAQSLSGGNLQKYVIGREVLQEPKVLIVNQPTWGVDAAAAGDIRNALKKLASNGAAVIVISQDLDELLEISDQFAVLVEGELSEISQTNELSLEKIGVMLGGELDQAKAENHHAQA